jgi:hypothetical protein
MKAKVIIISSADEGYLDFNALKEIEKVEIIGHISTALDNPVSDQANACGIRTGTLDRAKYLETEYYNYDLTGIIREMNPDAVFLVECYPIILPISGVPIYRFFFLNNGGPASTANLLQMVLEDVYMEIEKHNRPFDDSFCFSLPVFLIAENMAGDIFSNINIVIPRHVITELFSGDGREEGIKDAANMLHKHIVPICQKKVLPVNMRAAAFYCGFKPALTG